MNKEEVWKEALNRLQMQMTQATFDTWVKQTQLISYENNKVILGAESAFAKDWLENRLLNTINRTLNNILGYEVSVQFEVISDEPKNMGGELNQLLGEAAPSQVEAENDHQDPYQLRINPKYTFDQFIVGSSNRLAHAASLATAEQPGEAYNPLFLYGGVGLGKTHLLQAIAHLAIAKGKRVIYIASETFTNDLVDSIRAHATDAFRDKYRSTDFLLIDDIQFIAGKESTQEELFHTFNTLHSNRKQVVLSSDRPPKAIHSLEERLLSRFEWGLLADVQPPDLETRMAILWFKAESQNLTVPQDVIEFVARRAQNNIRELEGAFNKVVAHAAMSRQNISLLLATTALKDMVTRRSELNVDQILTAVAKFYRLDKKVLLGRNRTKEISEARQMAMYLAREETDASLPQIGEAMGGRDHTTVKHGLEKTAEKIEEDDRLRRDMLAIREIIYTDNNILFY